MDRSTFFKSAIGGVAAFFGIKVLPPAPAPPDDVEREVLAKLMRNVMYYDPEFAALVAQW